MPFRFGNLEKEIWADIPGSPISSWDLRRRKMYLLGNSTDASFNQGLSTWHHVEKKKKKPAGLRTSILRKTYLQDWPLAGIWKLGFGEGSHHFQHWEEGSLCLNCENKIGDNEYQFSFCKSGIWACARQRVPMLQPPIKILGTESLINFPGRQDFTCCHNS